MTVTDKKRDANADAKGKGKVVQTPEITTSAFGINVAFADKPNQILEIDLDDDALAAFLEECKQRLAITLAQSPFAHCLVFESGKGGCGKSTSAENTYVLLKEAGVSVKVVAIDQHPRLANTIPAEDLVVISKEVPKASDLKRNPSLIEHLYDEMLDAIGTAKVVIFDIGGGRNYAVSAYLRQSRIQTLSKENGIVWRFALPYSSDGNDLQHAVEALCDATPTWTPGTAYTDFVMLPVHISEDETLFGVQLENDDWQRVYALAEQYHIHYAHVVWRVCASVIGYAKTTKLSMLEVYQYLKEMHTLAKARQWPPTGDDEKSVRMRSIAKFLYCDGSNYITAQSALASERQSILTDLMKARLILTEVADFSSHPAVIAAMNAQANAAAE